MKVVVLAGGSGKRLWPVSRELYPKQFMSFDSKSLLQQTVERAEKYAEDIYVVTNDAQYYYVKYQLEGRVNEENILKEPVGRNTAPAIALSCKYIQETAGDGKVLVLPSDHLISDSFFDTVKKAEGCTERICLFGIKPSYPATGYGYIKAGKESGFGFEIEKFIEKPELELAGKLVAEGCLWNSGIFLFDISAMMEEFESNLPELYTYMGSFKELLANYHNVPNISIDRGIIEKVKTASVFLFNGEWKDIGSWQSIYEVYGKDDKNNALRGKVTALDTEDCLIWSEDRLTAALGLKDIIVVSTRDALLVAHMTRAEDVKQLVEELKNKNYVEALQHTTVYRQWGYYTILEKGPMYKVKKLCIFPGSSISHQKHYHRAEHWIVVKGTAKVIKDGQEIFLHENESIYVSKSVTHSIENPGKIELHIIEVQTGEYIEEDDIVRIEGDNPKK